MKRKNHESLINHFLTNRGHINRKQTWNNFGTHVTCSCGKTFHVPFNEITPESMEN